MNRSLPVARTKAAAGLEVGTVETSRVGNFVIKCHPCQSKLFIKVNGPVHNVS